MTKPIDSYYCGRPIFMHLPLESASIGGWVVTSKWDIQEKRDVSYSDMGNGKAYVYNRRLNRYFYDRYLSMRTHSYTIMLGAICGDVAGSVYEHHNIDYIPDEDMLISHHARFTDDSVMTLAVAVGMSQALKKCGKRTGFTEEDQRTISEEIREALRFYGKKYPYAGYGGSFRRWLASDNPAPYGSWGNGSAMRASYAGWAAQTLEDAELLGRLSAEVTHNHPYGIKGAVVVAGSIFILRNEGSKDDVAEYVKQYYNLDFTLDEIRESYHFDVSCEGSVPQAIRAFLEGDCYENVIARAISIGGDSDTIAAIAGSLAEIIYPIPEGIRNRVLRRLDDDFKLALADAIDFLCEEM